MGGLQPWHWLIVIAAFILLFGAKKLPDAARSLGKSMRIFKSEIKGLHDDDEPKQVENVQPARTEPRTESRTEAKSEPAKPVDVAPREPRAESDRS